MPEGPEIRRAADSLARILEGKCIETVRFGKARLSRHAKSLRGHRVTHIETRGKAMLTHFEHGLTIYSHNQLYGVWKIIKGHTLPASSRSVRLLLQTNSHSAILYSASDISVWPTEALAEHPFLAKVGPDIMAPELHWRDVAARLNEKRFVNRSFATLYLDQAFLAGNGNYLRSEILHDARINPRGRPADLSRADVGRLARSTLKISRRSYDTGGITLAPRLAGALQKQGLKRSFRRFYVFGRANRPCFHCGEVVVREEIAGRRLYHCLQCQPAT